MTCFVFLTKKHFGIVPEGKEEHYSGMGYLLGIIFALVVLVATTATLVFQWNANSTLKFERSPEAPVIEAGNY